MYESVMALVWCSLLVSACNLEHYGDCDEDELDLDVGNHSGAGKGPNGAGSSPGSAGSSPTEGPACADESDCEPGFNCEASLGQCLPAAGETCRELKVEAACNVRTDCTPVYAGIGCSCGPDCECVGGEPGCICESFDFFACEPLAM